MHLLTYILFRTFGAAISVLPYRVIHTLGRILGRMMYTLHRDFRKKTMTNLAIAFGTTWSEAKRKQIAIESLQNLMITSLEFFRLKKSRGKLSEIVTLQGGEEAQKLIDDEQGVIFLTAHQANWEIPFLALTNVYPGIAIGRPIKNPFLYRYVLSVREMNGGKIVMPKQAIKEGLRALKSGKFLGIVGDQAYTSSPYSYPLFGTRAWTASTPALLAYKTNSPLVVGMTKRENGRYIVTGSAPLWPDLSKPIKEEVPHLMDRAMKIIENSIQEAPGQWLWPHDRWKQPVDHVHTKYSFGFVAIILPPDPTVFLPILPLLRSIYSKSFVTVFAPEGTADADCTYTEEKDLYVRDWRFQIVFDFYDLPQLRRHYRKLGAIKILTLADLKKSTASTDLKDIISAHLYKSGRPPS